MISTYVICCIHTNPVSEQSHDLIQLSTLMGCFQETLVER